jgi:hypothetical protein
MRPARVRTWRRGPPVDIQESKEDSMVDTAQQLKADVDAARPRLLSIPEERAGEKALEGKWCFKEILGHLIDSASNNYQRIVRMQLQSDIGTFTYDQERWTEIGHYAGEPWRDIVECWYFLNAHLAHVIAHADARALDNVCDMGYGKPASLRFVIEDYVRHVEHHLEQILNESPPEGRKKWVTRNPF